MCPQLYINFKLRSVAHLPTRAMMYKLFNTFVDDIFAWLVEMPTKHRIMTLRDDVVLMVFLYQSWIYRVDKTRANEFGYVYESVPMEIDAKTSKQLEKKNLEETGFTGDDLPQNIEKNCKIGQDEILTKNGTTN
mmetsp:Transcript_40624/g.95396  ORF Transcript_40624/g.95396 Transcript_40624/m.95396 type:complete len:134 (-) Transcript_40624:41-442(-)